MILSDQHPITMSLFMPDHSDRSMIWRMDESLLLDPENCRQISDRLSQYFVENDVADTSQATLWTAHKCVIRGELISMTVKRNNSGRHV